MATHREGNRREMATHRGEEVERRWLHVERKDEKEEMATRGESGE